MDSEKIDRLLSVSGLSVPGRPPGDMPSLPEDITMLDDEGLMVLFTDLTVWADYADVQSALAHMGEKRSLLALEEERASLFTATRANGTSVTDTRAVVDSSTMGAIEVAKENSLVSYEKRRLVDSICSGLERDIALVSRELSRRLGEKSGSVHRRRAFGG